MITKTIKCDVKGCNEREETREEETLLSVGWLVRRISDRYILNPEGHPMGGESTVHYCPTHVATLTDLHPRIKQEIIALETLARHGNTAD